MKKTLKVEGMKCVHCKAHVEEACKKVTNVIDAVASLEDASVTITYNEEPSIDELRDSINNAGHYTAKF